MNQDGSIWDGEYAADESIAATVKGVAREAEARNERIARFTKAVQDMAGPLGALLRQATHGYASFCESELRGGTTAAEETRWFGLLDEAMDLHDWLTEGQS